MGNSGCWWSRIYRFPGERRTGFILIAENPVLANSSHGSNLPPSWRTLVELTKLPEEVLEEALDAGRITPELKKKRCGNAHLSHRAPVQTGTIRNGGQSG